MNKAGKIIMLLEQQGNLFDHVRKKRAGEIARFIMLNRTTSPYEVSRKFGIEIEKSRYINLLADQAFGVDGKGILWFVGQVDQAIKPNYNPSVYSKE